MTFIDPHNFIHQRVDIFISGSHHDAIDFLAKGLQKSRFSIFHSGLGIPAGVSFTAVIRHYLQHSDTILVCWSKHAVRSDWVNAEAEFGRVNGRLVACRLEKCDPLPPFNTFQTVDLVGWNGAADNKEWRELLSLLRHRKTGRLKKFSQRIAAFFG
jgi:hypothetical protein